LSSPRNAGGLRDGSVNLTDQVQSGGDATPRSAVNNMSLGAVLSCSGSEASATCPVAVTGTWADIVA